MSKGKKWRDRGLAMGIPHAHLATAQNVNQLKAIVENYQPAPAPAPTPPPIPTFSPPRLSQQLASNIGQSESGVMSARKKRGNRNNLASLKINLNPSAKPFGNVGTGLNLAIGALT